jgi:hypothetical protein
MITPLLQRSLEPVVARHRLLHTMRWSALALAAVGLAAVLLKLTPLLAIATALIAVWAVSRFTERWEPDYLAIAREIEQKHPELHALLLTAVEQQPDRVTGKLSFLQQRVLAEAVREAARHDWLDAIPVWKITAHLLAVLASCALLGGSLFMKREAPRRLAATERRPLPDGVEVTPGDVSLERGSGLVVLATFGRDLPSEATLVVQPRGGEPQRIPLVKNLDDPIFGGGIPEVASDLTYRVEYAGSATRDFTVRVFEHPRLERADANLHFPDYTRLPERQVPDTRRISAVEGTKLDLTLQLNKPVKSATLVREDGTRLPLTVEAGKPLASLREHLMQGSGAYTLQLEDEEGRASKVPASIVLDALPNRRPELKFATPRGDQRLSPLQEVNFRAETWDDFGIARYGLAVNVAGRGEQVIELGKDTAADERRELAHLVKLEEAGVKPDELVSWFLWAEDIGPDGKSRRTESDMFFGEVRPFEQIFRRGEDQQGEEQAGGGGAGGEAAKLSELQKQIITATWNLKRAEDGVPHSPSEKYAKDHPVVRDSQSEALKMTAALAEKLEEPKSAAFAEAAMTQMRAALEQLNAAEKAPARLAEAVAGEQLAYNALLKLAAHETRVSRSRNRGEGGGESGNQQQLDELEMKEEKQRYETKSEAAPMQNEQQQAQLAILNRLKELAQRQQDINERLKELQTALQAAQTEKEKEEIKRQLKRLREEEQQLLADLDEAREKMEQSPQQSQLAEERRKLDETRGDAQKAAEAMEQSSPSQALASGTRAARQLEQMRNDFRKKTSGRFNEEMREMRNDARELAEKQEQIAEQLAAAPQRRTLDSDGSQEQLARQFEQQQAALSEITKQMQRVSEEAEAAEPLLAKELYDTLRKTAQAGTEKKLEMTKELAQRGYGSQAQKFEEKAREEIEQLKSGVERAAESVLGDEAEALRQARAELDSLSEQLDQEIARARPELAQTSGKGSQDPQQDRGVAAGEAEEQDRAAEASEKGEEQGAEGAGKRPGEGEAKDSPSKSRPQKGQRAQGGKGEGDEQSEADAGAQPGQEPGEQSSANESSQTAQAPGEGKGRSQQPGEEGAGGEQGAESSSQQQGQTAQAGGQGEQPGQQQGSGGGGSSPATDGEAREGAEQRRRTLAQLGELPMERGGIRSGNNSRGLGSGGGGEEAGPLTGEDFAGWADRLRNVEEMVDNPGIRTEVARVREIAKGVRAEFKRHSVTPNWELVQTKISTPLAELRNRLTEELARRESRENLVPIDRDPVPPKYAEKVRRYYEELGRSR